MGDSVAASIGLALVAVAREHGVYVHNAAISGCGLIEGVASTPDGVLFPWSLACAELIARYERDVVAAHQPDVVVWMSAWESVDRSFEDGFRIRPGTVRGNLRLLAEIDEAAGRLRERGARLVLVLLAPPPAGSVDAARHDAIARLPYLNRLLEEYSRRHRDGVSVVYMSEFLCPSGPPCPDEVAGVTPRPDGVHFDAADGARWAAEQLVPRLVAPLVPGEPPVWAYVGVGRF